MKYLITLLVLFFSLSIFSQDNSNSKWSLGVDLNPVLDTSYHLKESIQVKYELNKKSKLRIRLGFTFDDVENRAYPTPELLGTVGVDGFRIKAYTAIGWERFLFHKEKISFFFAADMFLLYKLSDVYSFRDSTGNVDPPLVRDTYYYDRDYRIGINGVLGGSYNLTNHVIISIESFLQIAYRNELYSDKEYKNGRMTLDQGVKIKRVLSQIQPISAINLIYRF